ncbi:MAG: hypothetical protein ACT4P1_16360 [Sporichthyaceae bacterium]
MSRAVDEARWAMVAAATAAAICAAGLVGRLTGANALYAPVPGGGGLRVESAIALGLVAIAAVVAVRLIRAVALAVAGTLCVVSIAGYLGAPDTHVGSGPMALATAVCALLLVLSLAMPGHPRLRQLSAILAGALGLLVLIGFCYGTRTLARFSNSSMAVPAAVAIVLIALAALANTPNGWLPWALRGSDAGAVALRHTLPPVVLGLPVLTFLHMQGERRFWNDERVAEAGFVTLNVILVSALLFWVASSLRRLDQQREQARQDLLTLNARLVADVRTSYSTLSSAQQRIGSLEESQRAVLNVHDNVLQTIFASGLMLRTTLDTGVPPALSMEQTLESMDDAVRAIRRVVEDLNDQLGAHPAT